MTYNPILPGRVQPPSGEPKMMSFLSPSLISTAINAVDGMEEGGYTFLRLRSKVLYQAIPDFKGNIASIYPKKIEFAPFDGNFALIS